MQVQQPGALTDQSIQNLSVANVLSANVAIGQVSAYDSTGVPSEFSQDNGDGVMIRVASNANPQGLPQSWAGDGIDTTITHNLGRIPIGYYITKKTSFCDVYDGNVASTSSTITLQNTVGSTVDTVLYIF